MAKLLRVRKRPVLLLRRSKKVVLRKFRELQRIIPGCEAESVEVLLRVAADYIALLELQVDVMRSLADLHGAN